MNYRLKIYTGFGIPVYLHWSFSLIILYVVYLTYQAQGDLSLAAWGLFLLSSVFLCVLLHEYGHALAARYYGIKTEDITLLPIGGLARLKRMPEKPVRELVVAAAGPLVNVLIAGVLAIAIVIFLDGRFETQERGHFLSKNFIWILFQMNVFLVIFNLIPAFPMDGGRMLRAVIGFFSSRLVATNIAANVGKAISVVFIAKGFGLLPGIVPMLENEFMILIGMYIFYAASSEQRITQVSYRSKGVSVKDLMTQSMQFVSDTQTMHKAIEQSKQFPGHDFLVLNLNQQLIGLLPGSIIQKYDGDPNRLIQDVMIRDFTMARVSDKIKDAYFFMRRKKTNSLPVFDGEKLVGILYFLPIDQLIKGQKKPDQNTKV